MAYRTYRTDGTYDGTLDIAYPGSPSHLSPLTVLRCRRCHASDPANFAQFKGKTVMSPLLFVRSNLDRKIFDNNPLLPR
jgi:hypothetical protein